MDPSDKTTPALPSASVSFDSAATADESTSPDNPRISDHESNSAATADESTSPDNPRISDHESNSAATADESTSPDNPRISDHENNSVATEDESTPCKDPKTTYYREKDKTTFASGPLEHRYQDIEEVYNILTSKIEELITMGFQPTPWEDLKADDQRKLNSWTPHAKRFIQSRRGCKAIFEAWIWRMLDEGVFSADPRTKWRNHDNSFEAVKYLGQFAASIESQFTTIILFLAAKRRLTFPVYLEPQDTADGVCTGPTSVKKCHPVCYTSEWNKLRSASAELALRKSRNLMTMDPVHIVKFIKSNLGYLMKPEADLGSLSGCLEEISLRVIYIDTAMFISRAQPRLVWTDPLEQNEPNSWYGFPMDNKLDPEKEALDGSYRDSTPLEHRMRPVWDLSMRDFSVLEAASQGENVQLVVRPGMVARGREQREQWVFKGDQKQAFFLGDWKMISWLQPMHVVVSESFDPPIEEATEFDGDFIPAS
ncbi:hypothetical protein F5Y03DRAFT_388670 [Xylaria venustula]|nr:hypothetical protein F5Y03DRAFT_388670 [Xylaria venustula]